MTDHPSNGHQPVELAHVDTHAARAAERLAAQAQSLQELLTDEDAVQARLREALDESRARQHALQRAVAALTPKSRDDDAPTRGRPPGKTKTRDSNAWHVSAAKTDQVMQALVAYGEPVTGTRLAEGTSISPEAVRRSLTVLRDSGRVRLAGRSRGGGKLYAPMPEELPGADGAEGGTDDAEGGSVLWGASREAAS